MIVYYIKVDLIVLAAALKSGEVMEQDKSKEKINKIRHSTNPDNLAKDLQSKYNYSHI